MTLQTIEPSRIKPRASTRKTERTQRETLNDKEIEVIKLAADGFENHEIATALDLSIHTVTDRLKSIMRILAAANRTEACVRAIRTGVIK